MDHYLGQCRGFVKMPDRDELPAPESFSFFQVKKSLPRQRWLPRQIKLWVIFFAVLRRYAPVGTFLERFLAGSTAAGMAAWALATGFADAAFGTATFFGAAFFSAAGFATFSGLDASALGAGSLGAVALGSRDLRCLYSRPQPSCAKRLPAHRKKTSAHAQHIPASPVPNAPCPCRSDNLPLPTEYRPAS